MHEIESLIFLLAAAALLAQLARLLKVPYPILLVLGGLVMGFVPGLPDIEIPPEVIFVVFLPLIVPGGAGAFCGGWGVRGRVGRVGGGETLANPGTALVPYGFAAAGG